MSALLRCLVAGEAYVCCSHLDCEHRSLLVACPSLEFRLRASRPACCARPGKARLSLSPCVVRDDAWPPEVARWSPEAAYRLPQASCDQAEPSLCHQHRLKLLCELLRLAKQAGFVTDLPHKAGAVGLKQAGGELSLLKQDTQEVLARLQSYLSTLVRRPAPECCTWTANATSSAVLCNLQRRNCGQIAAWQPQHPNGSKQQAIAYIYTHISWR